MSIPTSLKVVKKKYYLCALPAKCRPNQYTVTENSNATGYLMTKEGKKTRNIDEALCLELETAVGEAWFGRDWPYFAPSVTVLIKGMICTARDEEDAMEFLRLHPLPRKTIGKKTREQVYGMFDGRCAYCGRRISLEAMQVDHILSHMSNGGEDTVDNYYPACQVCNRVKSALTMEQFRANVRDCARIHHKPGRKYLEADSDKIAEYYGLLGDNWKEKPIVFYFEKEKK